jgi:signal transduction histidine kinase
MAIAKRIVESHGGKIVAGRSDQTGAEIIVKLLRRQS